MIKVLVAGTRGIPGVLGGVETHCQELYPHLAALGCRITLVCRKRYTRYAGREYKGVKLVKLPAPAVQGLEAALHTLLAVLYAFVRGFRIIHLHGIGPALWAPLARLLGMRVIVTHHGADYHREKWGRFSKTVLRLGEWWGVKCAHRLIVIAPHIEQYIREKYHADNVTVIPNGCVIPVRDPDTEYLRSLGLEPGAYFLSVSRFVPEKGLDDLMAAYQKLQTPRFKLVLAGDAVQPTVYSNRLKQWAGQSGCVLTGYITGKPLQQLYSHAACFVIPSRHEGLSFALLDAAAYGLDIIASDIPANRELALPATCYFPAGETGALAELLQQRINKPKASPDLSRNLLPGKYHWNNIALQTLGIYTSAGKKLD